MTLAPCRSTKCPYAFANLSFQLSFIVLEGERKSQVGSIKSICYFFGLVLNLVKVHVLGLFMETLYNGGIKACQVV